MIGPLRGKSRSLGPFCARGVSENISEAKSSAGSLAQPNLLMRVALTPDTGHLVFDS